MLKDHAPGGVMCKLRGPLKEGLWGTMRQAVGCGKGLVCILRAIGATGGGW